MSDKPRMYHKCLGKFGYIVLKDQITKEQEKTLLKDLTVETVVLPAYQAFQKPKKYKIYYHSPSAYYIPRFYGLSLFGPADYMTLSTGIPLKAGLKCKFSPLKHQIAALAKAKKIFDPKCIEGGGGVLSLPCGYGKTYCATKIVSDYLGLAALIIVPTENLMDQWIDAISSFVPGARIGRIQCNNIDVQDKDYVVSMLHSISMKNYHPNVFSRFGITIFDECHHIGSEHFSKSMMKVRTRFVLGLSATPERRDGLSHVFYKFIGPLFHKEKRAGSNVIYIKKLTLNSNSENYQKLTMNGVTNTQGMTTAISKLVERNVLTIFILRQLIKQGRKILLLSSRKEHLTTIKEMLDAEGIKSPATGKYITYGFYYGRQGMNRDAHRELLAKSAKCDIILGIDALAKEGLDIPDLNTLVFATPPGIVVEQPVGRILRKFHKDINPIVIDLVDNTGNYVKHSAERDKWYIDEGNVVQNIFIDLIGDSHWSEQVQSYIHTKQPTPQKTPELTDEATEPHFGSLVLFEDGEAKLSPKIKKKRVNTNTRFIKPSEPNMVNCLLATQSQTVTKPKPREKRTPDFDELLLPSQKKSLLKPTMVSIDDSRKRSGKSHKMDVQYEYRKQSDAYAMFMDDYFYKDDEGSVKLEDSYGVFKNWYSSEFNDKTPLRREYKSYVERKLNQVYGRGNKSGWYGWSFHHPDTVDTDNSKHGEKPVLIKTGPDLDKDQTIASTRKTPKKEPQTPVRIKLKKTN